MKPRTKESAVKANVGESRSILIVSHVTHYAHNGQIYAYEPYAREIDIWASMFSKVEIAAPLACGTPPGDTAPINSANLTIRPIPETGGTTLLAKAKQIASVPRLVWLLASAMRQADAIHVRCPGNLGLLGALLAPLFSGRLVAKYAGQWSGYRGEAATVKLQRAILRSRWWRGPVTVYGRWPNQPPHVVPFFSSAITRSQMERAKASSRNRTPAPARNVLFVGRLTSAKNIDALMIAIAALRAEGLTLNCTVLGSGPQSSALEAQARSLGISANVNFPGAVSFSRVLDYYEQNSILVLVSESEGWPKVIAEAMSFGMLCIGSNTGIVPQMLGEGRGIAVTPGSASELASALRAVAADPNYAYTMGQKASTWAQKYTLEYLKESLEALLDEWWQHDAVPDTPAHREGAAR